MAYTHTVSRWVDGRRINYPIMPNGYTSQQVCSLAGVTYRQLDYWKRKGYVTPSVHASYGTGDPCVWSADDLKRVRFIESQIVEGFTVQAAVRTADEAGV